MRFSLTTCFFLIAVIFLSVPPIIDVVNGAIKSKGPCRIVLVMDGDTVKIVCPDSDIGSARIMGYDAPEKNARCLKEFATSMQATWALRVMLWQAQAIEIKVSGKDRYDRSLIHLEVNGEDVALAMVNTGVARIYHGGRRGSWCE